MKIMFVHGIGFHEAPVILNRWVDDWTAAISRSCISAGVGFDFNPPLGADGSPGGPDGDPGIMYYEDLIRQFPKPGARDYLEFIAAATKSYIFTKMGDAFRRERGMLDIPEEIKWKTREVAAWACDETMRSQLRKRVVKEIESKNPDVVIAHSYGGLITYDACMFEKPDLLKNRYYVTLGTQIGNPCIRNEYAGRQLPVQCKHWFNLYNPADPVLVYPLDHIRAENFSHLVIAHDKGHDGEAYLGHADTASQVWGVIAEMERNAGPRARSFGEARTVKAQAVVPRPQVNRALLIGIDRYDSPEIPPLQGCVNDTFQLSAALQEAGFLPQEIRMLHNRRATRNNLLIQIQWLLADALPGDHRFLSFSGHGHRMASYDANGNSDSLEEILCTHDYAFTQKTGLRDRDFQDLYAHLDPGVHFLIFLDCCHSGGITRAGGPAARSFNGPSDLEHEYMRWNPGIQMWEQMGVAGKKGLNERFLPKAAGYNKDKANETTKTQEQLDAEYRLYYGEFGDTRRIGRATPLRDLPHLKFDKISAKLRELHGLDATPGPYLPMVFMACKEDEKACEYLHGSVSFGAYTYAVAQTLRDFDKGFRRPTYQQLHEAACKKLESLGYTQKPDLLGTSVQLNSPTPFGGPAPAAAKSRVRKTGSVPQDSKAKPASKRGPASKASKKSRR